MIFLYKKVLYSEISFIFELSNKLKTNEMKLTIELSEVQVKGIKEYLKDVSDIEKPSKSDIKTEIEGMLSAELQSGAIYDYISKYEN